MAVDEAILESFISGQSIPTLRFYGWSESTISIGKLQPISSIPQGWGSSIVRRPTGGRAVFHGNDLTFSLVVGAAVLGHPVHESYRRVGQAVGEALQSLEIPAQFCQNTSPAASIREIGNCFDLTLEYELTVGGKKVLGSAQVRRAEAVLQQNSLAPPSKDCTWPERDDLVAEIIGSVESSFGIIIEEGRLSETELKIARHLTDNKYAIESWNLCSASHSN